MAGEIPFIAMVITRLTIFLYVSLNFGTPLLATVVALVAEILVLILAVITSEILRPI